MDDQLNLDLQNVFQEKEGHSTDSESANFIDGARMTLFGYAFFTLVVGKFP